MTHQYDTVPGAGYRVAQRNRENRRRILQNEIENLKRHIRHRVKKKKMERKSRKICVGKPFSSNYTRKIRVTYK